jgi:aminobenzoyl-glutamate utilization protein B
MSPVMQRGYAMPDREAVLTLASSIEGMKPEFTALSDQIWEFAELKFDEYRSSGLLAEKLEENGFRVRRNIAEMETAFIGEFGSGRPVIAFLGEFDALAGMSQVADIAEARPVAPDTSGHGCGHNLLGVGSLLAAIALARHLEENGLPGPCAITAARAKRAAPARLSWCAPAPSTMSMRR